MKEISLTQGQVALVDDEDFEELARFKWFAHRPRVGASYYARRKIAKDRFTGMHNVLLGVLGVDHIDGNGLNNQRGNLRPATPGQNARNTRLSQRNKSGFKGVWWNTRLQTWRAEIFFEGRKYDLGRFDTPEQGAAAYAAAALELHGDFARVTSFAHPDAVADVSDTSGPRAAIPPRCRAGRSTIARKGAR